MNLIESKLYISDHWMVCYKVDISFYGSEIKDG